MYTLGMEIFLIVVLCLILIMLVAIWSSLDSINWHLSEIENIARGYEKEEEHHEYNEYDEVVFS